MAAERVRTYVHFGLPLQLEMNRIVSLKLTLGELSAEKQLERYLLL